MDSVLVPPSPTMACEEVVGPRFDNQLTHFIIPPLRDPIPLCPRKAPSPLEPDTCAIRNTKYACKAPPLGNVVVPSNPSTTDKRADHTPHTPLPGVSLDPSQSISEPSLPSLPFAAAVSSHATTRPAFINLQALEKFSSCQTYVEKPSSKRRRVELNGDNFGDHLQLPLPTNQIEPAKPPPPFGPLAILNGLHEPPPNVALFPPIETTGSLPAPLPAIPDCVEGTDHRSSITKEERRGTKIKEIVDVHHKADTDDAATMYPAQSIASQDTRAKKYNRTSRKQTSPRATRKKTRRWTEEETNELLKGVARCGFGNWTMILAQEDLKFIDRTPTSLKDRFRVCCPWAYQSYHQKESQKASECLVNGTDAQQPGKIYLPDPRSVMAMADPTSTSAITAPPQLNLQNTGIDGVCSIPSSNAHEVQPTQNNNNKRKSRPAGRSKFVLISLGVIDPSNAFKANRRNRRLFTPAEDEALLKGYAVHGFQWSMIQKDKHLGLLHRRATDLRDRFRTKFPKVYKEGGPVTVKDGREVKEMNEASSSDIADTTSRNEATDYGDDMFPPTPCDEPEREPMKQLASIEQAFEQPDDGLQVDIHDERDFLGLEAFDSPNDISLVGGSMASMAAPIDPVMLPPAPPSHSAFFFPFLDDVITIGSDHSGFSWNDMSLQSMPWYDF
ncbi:hypothetical protein FQN57_006484 [Myotisia sp. PD_48]|nr:hypothetical protein FQN57_006484 [Myotisia sp. PD_48]